MKLLRALPWVAVLEKASIDEAYLLLLGSTAGTAGWDDDPDPDCEPRGGVSPAAALQRAREAKAVVQQQLGLCVSVGVAPNRLLAKLASAAAKPDGVLLVPDQAAALELLSRTSASRLPGYGGKAAEAFERREAGAGRGSTAACTTARADRVVPRCYLPCQTFQLHCQFRIVPHVSGLAPPELLILFRNPCSNVLVLPSWMLPQTASQLPPTSSGTASSSCKRCWA